MYKRNIQLAINYSKIFFTLFLVLSFSTINAQEEKASETKDYVSKTFYATSLINTQTTEAIPLGQLKFTIKHRFGMADLNEDFLKDFFGMDASANIRFGFQVPLTPRLYVGIGRTKFKKQYDFEIKYALLKQTTNNSTPLNLSLYANLSISSDDFPEKLDNFDYFHQDSATAFNYNFNHRLAYNYQFILSRKFFPWFSTQIAPQITYRNLVDVGKENMTVALPMGFRFKVAFFSSIQFEYVPVFNTEDDQAYPWSIGYEVGTAGHSFQFFMSNSSYIMNQYQNPGSTTKLSDGQFYFGFNIHRYLWLNN